MVKQAGVATGMHLLTVWFGVADPLGLLLLGLLPLNPLSWKTTDKVHGSKDKAFDQSTSLLQHMLQTPLWLASVRVYRATT